MGHAISAIIVKDSYDKKIADLFDLVGLGLGFDLTLFHIDSHYTEYWQARLKTKGLLEVNDTPHIRFPNEFVISELVYKITGDRSRVFAVIATDYFGGIGGQFANAYKGSQVIDKNVTSINEALKALGISVLRPNPDEFDTVGLGKHCSTPDYLDNYGNLTEELVL